MTCQEVIDYLLHYLEDELPAEEKETFEQHLTDCPPCVNYLDSYRETIRAGRAACCSDDAVCNEIPDDLVRAILAARREQKGAE